jgi:hypothetical protein
MMNEEEIKVIRDEFSDDYYDLSDQEIDQMFGDSLWLAGFRLQKSVDGFVEALKTHPLAKLFNWVLR